MNKETTKNMISKAQVVCVLFFLICLLIDIPFTNAYFSAHKTSAPIIVLVEGKNEAPAVSPAQEDQATDLEEEEAKTDVAAIEIDGPAEIAIPHLLAEDQVDHISFQYTAIVFNEQKEKMSDEKVNWSLAAATPGVTISDDGVVTVTSEAVPGSCHIYATSQTNEQVAAALEVLLILPHTDSSAEPVEAGEEIAKDTEEILQ